MFQSDTQHIQQFREHAHHQDIPLIDFGIAPTDDEEREDWVAEVQRLILLFHLQGYTLKPIASEHCSAYRVSEDSEGRDDDITGLERVAKHLIQPGQHVVVHGSTLELHVLGDENA